MSDAPAGREFFVWTLFQQLVRRNFSIGLEEYGAVLRALRAGFGWSSRDDLKLVLCALWANSREETAVVSALFDQYVISDWNVALEASASAAAQQLSSGEAAPSTDGGPTPAPAAVPADSTVAAPNPTVVAPSARMPPLKPEELPRLPYSHVFLPQYPVRYRDVAQTWRRLRWPLREGPPVELDVDATVARRSRSAVASPPVLRPRRRNQANLLLLVDRKGSMAPFHGYVDEVCAAISQAGRLGRVRQYYFHDTPLEGADLTVLDALERQAFSSIDAILGQVQPLTSGVFYTDAELLDPYAAELIFKKWSEEIAIVIVSDAGAARGRVDIVRLLDTIATLKGLLALSSRLVWLNPLPPASWTRSTAAHIARHVPMFPMDRDGMHRAVNVLRGKPFSVARPLPRAAPPLATQPGGERR